MTFEQALTAFGLIKPWQVIALLTIIALTAMLALWLFFDHLKN